MSLHNRLHVTPPTRPEYLAIFLEALAGKGIVPTDTDAEALFLRLPGGNSVYLDNSYSEFSKARPAERQAILDRYIAAALAMPDTAATYEEARPTLLPVLRAGNYASMVALGIHAGDQGSRERTASLAFASGLILALVRDTPETMIFVKRSTLAEWGVSEEEALQTALGNLRDGTAGPEFAEHSPGLFRAIWADGYSTSRVALPELFADLPLEGDPIFFAPTRDQLWVTGHRDSFNQALVLKLGEASHFESYPLSPNLYRLAGGKWELFTPDDPVVARALEGLQQRRAHLDYQQQKPMLEAILLREGQDVFVASHNLYESAAGELFSICIWTRDVDSLLPLTDRIMLFINGDPGERVTLPWQVAMEHLPGLIVEDTTYLPPRYRVRSFPDARQWKTLRKLESQTGK